jgi:hypothetical protein
MFWQDIADSLDSRSRIDVIVIAFEVKLPSACSFIVDGLAFCCRCSHYMFRLTWPSSGVYDLSLFIPEGICFAPFVAFVACRYTMQFLICGVG